VIVEVVEEIDFGGFGQGEIRWEMRPSRSRVALGFFVEPGFDIRER
jgi:hypothetical protein